MFTGIVEEVGRVEVSRPFKEGFRLSLKAGLILQDLKLGDSVAVNGVCLTVALLKGNGSFELDVMPETMRNSNISELSTGNPVNLERAMRFDGRFGGHFISGHVDGVAGIIYRRVQGNSIIMGFSAPDEIIKNMIKKGSVAIDGISLTITGVAPGEFSVSLIPHTLKNTALENKKKGDKVNIETDMIGKYISHFLDNFFNKESINEKKELTMEYLLEKGF